MKTELIELGAACAAGGAFLGGVFGAVLSRLARKRDLLQRLSSFAAKLGSPEIEEPRSLDQALAVLEVSADQAAVAVAEAGHEVMVLRRALEALPAGAAIYSESLKPLAVNSAFSSQKDVAGSIEIERAAASCQHRAAGSLRHSRKSRPVA